MSLQPGALDGASEVYIIERRPKPGDYPDSACEYLLPDCDIVIMTASAAINKTLPRLLELSKNSRIKLILCGQNSERLKKKRYRWKTRWRI